MCGIVGVVNNPEASNLVYLGLYAVQHRGQEAAGIVSSNGEKLFRMRRKGLVEEGFKKESFTHLKGPMAIGHVRYSTTGDNIQRNYQPFIGTLEGTDVSVAHNGNLTNFKKLKTELQMNGAVFQSTMDTEVILHLIARSSKSTLQEKILDTLKKLEGAFSLLLLSNDQFFAIRDPWGFRPLSMGRKKDGTVVFASETCAFDLVDAVFERDILPGEMLVMDRTGKATSLKIDKKVKTSQCVFEHVYFSRPDSQVYEKSVYQTRKNLGRELAKEHTLTADCVIPVPDSGVLSALGYAQEMNIPFQMGLIRNHYVGRTFIEPEQSIRGFGVKLKLNPVKSELEGKHVIVVDDSIVRGTTSKKIVKMLREAGVKKITMMISSPPFANPCFYGIDTPNKDDLIASKMTLSQIRDFIEVDELRYLSLEGMYKAVGTTHETFCDACFTGKYPV